MILFWLKSPFQLNTEGYLVKLLIKVGPTPDILEQNIQFLHTVL